MSLLPTIALYAGIVLTVLGLVGLGACIRRALAIRRAGEAEAEGNRAAMHRLVALNMVSVGTAFFGLALVVVGALLRQRRAEFCVIARRIPFDVLYLDPVLHIRGQIMTIRLTRRAVLASSASAALVASATGAQAIISAAPGFSLLNSRGESVSLADFRGSTVVLEWTNHDCPYVGKHYNTGNMQALQTAAIGDGIVWLSIISSAPGKQGHVSGAEADALTQNRSAAPTHVLFDPEGTVGRAYDAKTTPQMVVIDGSGAMVYNGAIDDQPSFRPETVPTAHNYLTAALEAVAAGRAVETARTRPYGCSVKY